MVTRYNKASLRRQIYGALSSYLDQACVIDTSNPEYMDALYAVQEKMAEEFRTKAKGEMVSDEDVKSTF